MVRSRLLMVVLASVLALSLAACVQRVAEDDDNGAGDRPVPTPIPTEPADDSDDDDVDNDVSGDWYELLVTDKTYPDDETGEEILELAESQEAFDEWRERFHLEDILETDDLDWETHAVLFAGTGESGSCPLELVDVLFHEDERLVEVQASRDVPADTMCTMDWTPRVFVIALDRDVLGEDELFAVITDPEFDQEIDPDRLTTIRD